MGKRFRVYVGCGFTFEVEAASAEAVRRRIEAAAGLLGEGFWVRPEAVHVVREVAEEAADTEVIRF